MTTPQPAAPAPQNDEDTEPVTRYVHIEGWALASIRVDEWVELSEGETDAEALATALDEADLGNGISWDESLESPTVTEVTKEQFDN